MNIGLNQTSFGATHLSKKGLEEVKKRPNEHIQKVLDVVENAQNSIETDFIINDEGQYYVKNPKYGEVRLANPSSPHVYDNYFCCKVVDKNDEKKEIGISLPSQKDAEAIVKKFGPGAYMPDLNLELYRAMEAQAAYKNSMMNKLNKYAE